MWFAMGRQIACIASAEGTYCIVLCMCVLLKSFRAKMCLGMVLDFEYLVVRVTTINKISHWCEWVKDANCYWSLLARPPKCVDAYFDRNKIAGLFTFLCVFKYALQHICNNWTNWQVVPKKWNMQTFWQKLKLKKKHFLLPCDVLYNTFVITFSGELCFLFI